MRQVFHHGKAGSSRPAAVSKSRPGTVPREAISSDVWGVPSGPEEKREKFLPSAEGI
jgi:hypothetical protein